MDLQSGGILQPGDIPPLPSESGCAYRMPDLELSEEASRNLRALTVVIRVDSMNMTPPPLGPYEPGAASGGVGGGGSGG